MTGVACGATSVVVPMYLGEVSPPHLRGFLGTVHQLLCVVGMLVAQVLGLPALLGTRELWPLYLLLVLVPAAALLALRSRLAESPSWLSRRSQEDAQAAQAILARLRGEPPTSLAVLKELDFMQVSGSAELEIPGYKYGVRQMLRDTTTRNGLTITVVCAVAQQFSGINNAFNFSSAFLAQNGIGASTVTLIAVLMNVGNVLITLLSASLGTRRPPPAPPRLGGGDGRLRARPHRRAHAPGPGVDARRRRRHRRRLRDVIRHRYGADPVAAPR